uniref:guanylate cyclase n=1 Tax=Arion vulgaris TaxID=1028688 RepID=A0A0B7BN18_9EUPU
MKGVGRTIFTDAERVHLLAFSKSFLLIFIVFVHIIFPSASQNVTVEPFYYNYSECYSLNNNRPIENMTQLDLNVAFFTGVSSGQGKWYGGAFFLAIETLNNIAKECHLPVQFNWTFRDAGNRESFAMKEIVDLYCAQNISAFIGPDVHCKTMGLLATGLNIPYITYNCQETHNETGEQLLINTETSFVYISRFIASVLHHYKWTSFWLVTGKEPRWQSAAKQLKASAFVMNITINGETVDDSNDLFSSYVYRSHKYRKVLTDSKDHTRVYVFLGVFESLLLFLREMANLGMTSTGKYAVIAADDSKGSTLNETFYLTTFEIGKHFVNLTETEKRDKLSAFKNVLVVRPAKGDVHIQKFEDAVYSKNIMPPIKLIETPKWLNSKPNIPIQAYQLFDAAMFYGKAVMALMNTQDADPTNATQIINYLRRRSHNSIQGETIWIHGNGESQGTYKVESLVTGQDGNIERRLVEVGSFTSNNGIDQIYVQKRKAFWVSGTPPVSNPNCGFDETCSKLPGWKIAIIVIGVFLFVLFVVIILILGLRHYMYEQKLERLAWKIEREDIQILNDGQFKDLTTPFRPRKKDSYSGNQLRTFLMALDSDPDITDGSCSSDGIPVGVYKGTDVAVRKLTRKNLELTRALKKQLQLRKELTHENINRFIGACIDIPYVYMVTQYCTRASLQDILRNEVSPLDDMFSTSLVQDLIRGMSFIHDSEIGYHGNLKSSNCLWTVVGL